MAARIAASIRGRSPRGNAFAYGARSGLRVLGRGLGRGRGFGGQACLAFAGALKTAHDIAEGGLLVTLAEATFALGLGARLDLPGEPLSLFSESQARAVIAVAAQDVDRALAQAEELGVPAREIGVVGGESLEIRVGGDAVRLDVRHLRAVWREALPRALDG